VDWIFKKDPTICCLQEKYLTGKDKHNQNVKEWKIRVAIFISKPTSNQNQSAKTKKVT
jgi:hypothetical protein